MHFFVIMFIMIITSAQLYPIVTNFEKLNERFSKDNFYLPLFSTLALVLCTPSSSLLNRVALVSCAGIVAIKGLLIASAYVQGKIAPAPQRHRKNRVTRSTDRMNVVARAKLPPKQITKIAVSPSDERKKNYDLYERLIWNSFPDPDFSTRFPDPIPYTYEQLEGECEQWLEYSLRIAQEDRDFSPMQHAYQKIFNLPESTKSPIYDNFPQENREILIGWKERFFTPGTKQYEWRVKYNQAIEAN